MWRKVSEELPPDETWVFVHQGGSIVVARIERDYDGQALWARGVGELIFNEGYGWSCGESELDDAINPSHWHPLPELPEQTTASEADMEGI